MPQKEDYIEMLSKGLQGLRSSIQSADLDLLCTFIYNYSGREVAGALRGTFVQHLTHVRPDIPGPRKYCNADSTAGQTYV